MSCLLLCLTSWLLSGTALADCPTIPVPVHGQATGVCTGSRSGDSCRFQCQPGYRLVGSAELRCKPDTKWTDFVPLCQLVQCLGVWAPFGGHVSCTGAVPGDTCDYACDQGFIMEGANTATCRPDGTWTDFPPVCKKISCLPLYPDSNGATTGNCDAASIGESCLFLCNDGYDLVGHFKLVCSAEGHWSGEPPRCIKHREHEVELEPTTPKTRQPNAPKGYHQK